MKKIRFSAIIALFLVICMMLTSCDWLLSLFGKGPTVDPPQDDDKCYHKETVLVGKKDATCISEGYTGDTVCTECTALVTPGSKTPMLDHTYDEGRVTKEPTCIETGVTTYTCTGCGSIKNAAIKTVDHNDAYHDAQDGTHYHTCTKCTLNENEEHTPKDAGKYVAATCNEAAYIEFACADCKGVYKVYSETELATGHDMGDWETIDSTCSEDGEKHRSCNNCDLVESVVIPASNIHNYVFYGYTTKPDCTNDGEALYVCDGECGNYEYRTVAKTGVHNYVELESTGDGWVRKECSVCHDLISSFDASAVVKAEVKTDDIDKDVALEMNMQNAAIQFPTDVVSQITSGTDVAVSADVLDETAKNEAINNVADEESKAILADAPIYDFTVEVDGEVFNDTFSTQVAITVPYDNGDNDADGIVIYYLANDGTLETITDVTYNPETKEVTFFVSHFSFYAVAYKETQEMRCKRGLHEYEATNTTVTATCFNFGYTVYECICCHKTTIDNIVERAEHNYGDIIDAHPTCDQGDYITRICQNEGCGHVLNVKFVGATGHAMDKPATCETPSTCTKCGKILTRALGHNWTEWETVVEPTEITSGLRRRWCLTCGKVEEATLASTGEIDAIEFESYVELLDLILGDVIGMTSGTIDFAYGQGGFYYRGNNEPEYEYQEVRGHLIISKTNNGYRMNATLNVPYYVGNNVYETQEINFYYDNGVFVATSDREDTAPSSDINHLVPLPIDIFKAVAEDLHSQLDDYVKLYLDQTRDLIDTYSETFGDDIDAILEAADVPYTVDELDNLLNSIETVYAYLSLKLGYDTSMVRHEDLVKPTPEEIKEVLSAFMESTEENGVTTYSLSASPILDATRELLDFTDEHINDNLADFIYFLIEEEALEYNAELVDFNAIIDLIAKEFPGTLTLSDAVDKYITFSEENDFISLSNVYSMIDNLALEVYGQEINSEQMVKDNGEISLNDFIKSMTGSEEAEIEQLYTAIKDAAAQVTLGEVYFRGATISQISEYLRMVLDNSDISADLSLSIDEDGRLVALNIDHEFLAREDIDNPEDELMKILGFEASIVHDDSVVVEIPESIQNMMVKPNTYLDENGNYVIEGLIKDAEYNFSLDGSAYIPFDEVLSKDDAVTSGLGKDVYVTKPEYWTNTESIGDYYFVDGKYYSYYYDSCGHYIKVYDYYTLEDMIAQLGEEPDEDDISSPVGILAGTDDIPVHYYYHGSNIGVVYQIDGEWMIATQYGDVYDSYRGEVYVTNPMPFSDFASTLTIGSTKTYYRYDDDKNPSYAIFRNGDGEKYTLLQVNIAYGDGSRTISQYGFMMDGELKLVGDYNGFYDESYHKLYHPITELPEHDYSTEYNTTIDVLGANGEISTISARHVYLYNKLPSYYVKVADGIYTSLNSSYIRSTHDTKGKEAITLPDGNILYVDGRTMDNQYGYRYGYETVYGYAETASGMYIQTALIMNGEEIVELLYRNAEDTYYANADYILDINKYITKDENGTYTIAAEAINKLNSICTSGSLYMISVSTEYTVGELVGNYMYYLPVYAGEAPKVDIDDLFGNSVTPNWSFWENIFGYGSGNNGGYYFVTHNDDGSITLTFPNSDSISVYYSSFYVPIDDKLVYNQDMSDSSGLNIYTYTGSYEASSSSTYVYQDGKYYYIHYIGGNSVYDFKLSESTDFMKSGWRISSMYYRFDMVGGNGLPENLRVYETDLYLGWSSPYYSNPYIYDLYVFFIDGEMQVAVEAKVTGESLLTFESYMPIDEYIDSLEFVINDSIYDWYTINYNGTSTTMYITRVYAYETDGEGNRLGDSYKYSFYVSYILDGGKKMYIVDYTSKYYTTLTLGSEADMSNIPADAKTSQYTETYTNGNFTFVTFSWKTTETYTRNFIKLAGRYYQYDYSHYYSSGTYEYEKLYEWEFTNQAIGKVWYYAVEDDNGNWTYYTEFIPSDSGFKPSGSIVDPDTITGSFYNYTLLGYTADGYALYEVVYLVDESSDDFEYTTEVQADGTVFYHKDGMGYLQVKEKYNTYYVKARKVTMSDGSTQIYCFLRGAVMYSSDYSAGNQYITVEDNTVTISPDLLSAAAASGKNNFSMRVYAWNTVYFNYYQLESLFMMK